MKKAKNIKKSTRAVALVLAASMLVGALQTFAYALPEEELLPYLIEFSDMQSANEFEAEVGENAEILNGTIVKAELGQIRAESLERSAQVNYIEEDYIVRANEEEAPSEGEPELTEMLAWSSKAVGAEYSLAQGETGSGVKIAVLDSGLDVYSEVRAYGGIDLEDPEYCCGDDLTGHGTVVSGIIAAPADEAGIVGIAPEAEIYVVRVLDSANEAPISRIIEGIDWCMENDIDIINMSFGTENYSQAFEAKIAEAAQAGLLLVSSAGNGESVEYPAKFDEVIAVGAVGSDMTVSDNSATGSELEFAAPGENVYSTSLIGGYAAASGTSIAAPHVAGAAAVILGKDRTKSAEFVRALLAASAKPLGSAASCGNGIPDLEYALQIYDDFAANYADASYIPPANSGNAATYEDEDVFVVGQWNTSSHNNLATEFFNNESWSIIYPKFIKDVSYVCDRNFSDVILLHSNGNYIVGSKILFEISVEYKTKGSGFDHTNYRSDLAYVSSQNNNTDAYYLSLMNSITQMIETYTSANNRYSYDRYSYGKSSIIYNGAGVKQGALTDNIEFLSESQKKATVVFGMFFHLAGDIYAHRSIVPPTSASVISATTHGASISGGNNGHYFVSKDFVSDCNGHVVFADYSKVESTYSTNMAQIKDRIEREKGLPKMLTLFWYIWYSVMGKNTLRRTARNERDRKQKTKDIVLLMQAQRIPSLSADEDLCCGYSGCYGMVTRLAGLGVLQYKDIKYSLVDIDKWQSSNHTLKTETLKSNWNYYEDQGISGAFYLRRYMAAGIVTKRFLIKFFASVGTNAEKFLPYDLLPVYDDIVPYVDGKHDVQSDMIKIDQYYNYLLSFHPNSNVLKKSTWNNTGYSLFNFSTILDNGEYFIDPKTYKTEEKPLYYTSVFPTSFKEADSFYVT